MEIRTLTLRAAAAVLTLLFAAVCPADPPSIASLATNRDLSGDERAAIQAYAAFWGGALAGGSADDAAEVDRATQRLLDPLAVGNATERFRDEYGRALKDSLDQALSGGSEHIAVNATVVVSRLGTERALDTLVGHAAARYEDRWQIRLRAARGARDLLEGDTLRPSSGAKISGAARRLRDAARDEDNPLALAYQLQAILAADLAPLTAAQHGQTRQYLVEALTSTAERAAAAATIQEADEFYRAAYNVLADLLGRLLSMTDLHQQQEFGRLLGPCLYEFLSVPTAWWDNAQGAANHKDAFRSNISASETALRQIDRFVRSGQGTPDTRLKDAWDANDPDSYGADLALWEDVLKRAPYGQ